ncbi:MAG: FeoB-associated Cys-rich membrane protein [Pedobacter sp.]|nr:FeoB-associated Cys-rich membrane protein [Pedobacter sp.]
MDVQMILILLIFAGAVFYIGRIIFKAVSAKSGGCASNCKCGVDFSNINPEKQ